MTKTKTTVTWLTIAGAVVLAVVFSLSRSVAVEAAYPVERARLTFAQKVWSRVRGVFSGAAAMAENVRLRREAAALAMVWGDVERLEAENGRLRKALGYAESARGRWLAAAVLSREGGAAGTRDTLRVARGSLSGVKVGAVVAVPEGLVGRVVAVTPHTAEVRLVTDRTVKVSCVIEVGGGKDVHGILSGGSERSLVLRYLKGAAEVPPRSRVLTSGLGGVFPKGIEVGTFLDGDVGKDENGLARESTVLPAVEYSTLEDVFIRREN